MIIHDPSETHHLILPQKSWDRMAEAACALRNCGPQLHNVSAGTSYSLIPASNTRLCCGWWWLTTVARGTYLVNRAECQNRNSSSCQWNGCRWPYGIGIKIIFSFWFAEQNPASCVALFENEDKYRIAPIQIGACAHEMIPVGRH